MKCARCGIEFACLTGRVNRARAIGAPLYCGRACVGLARRLANPPTETARKETKRLYDEKRRAAKYDEICAAKRAYYHSNRARILPKQAVYRKAHMHRHIEYCRRPEYKAWKVEYDRHYSARQSFGEFADAFLLLQDIENEVAARATRYEIYSANGTLNKAQTRRRSL